MTIEDLIQQAELNWNMERLYKDLGLTKYRQSGTQEYRELSREYQWLCALLCECPIENLAKILNLGVNGLRVELTKGLYESIKELVEDRAEMSIKRLQPIYIPIYLGKLGYKKKMWKIKSSVKDISSSQIEEITAYLREKLGDPALTLEDINKGSIILIFNSSQEAFERANALFEAGELSELLGIPILDVQPVTTKVTRTVEQQHEFATSLLKRCRREGYDWIELPSVLEILDAVRQAYLTKKEAIEAAFTELLYMDTLATSVSKNGADQDAEYVYEEEDLEKEFLNTLSEEVIKFYEE